MDTLKPMILERLLEGPIMRAVAVALSVAFCLVLAVGLITPPVLSAPRQVPGLPSITLPGRGLRLEWAFRPSSPLSGSHVGQMPTMVSSSLRNLPSGKHLGVQNGAPALVGSQDMEFLFVPRVQAKVLGYSHEMALRTVWGQYLIAAALGQTPVLVLSDRPSFEWVVLGGHAGTPVPVGAVVALGNAVVRHDGLVYCPGTTGLELSWGRVCPTAPSAPGEQPVGVASPKPLPSLPSKP